MKKFIYTIGLIVAVTLSSQMVNGQDTPVRDTLSMGPTYASDIFYSFKNGEVSKVARDTWDIAFFTPRFSAGIITNEGNGVQLFTYPNGDTSAWATVDTNGMAGWKIMYNSPEYWEEGAFNINATGHPDYGWGIYNMINHNVYGDSLFVITTPAGVKKLMIIKKISIDNIYVFKYADLDGANEHKVEFDVKPYETKNFAYYSLENNTGLDREPEKDTWDLLFTKYIDSVPDNQGNLSPYLVTGATNNVDVYSNNIYPAEPDFSDWSSIPFDSTKNAIGYDWKSFDMGTFQWTVTDSNYYFVSTADGDIYKLQFIYWQGSMTGVFALDKWLISLASIDEGSMVDQAIEIYPNPAQSSFTLKVKEAINADCRLMIMDQAGRLVYQNNYPATDVMQGIRISNLELSKGLYLVTISNKEFTNTQKLIIH